MAGVTEYLKRYSVLGWLVGANVAVFVVVGLSLVMARAGLGIELDSFVTLPSVWEVFLREPWTLLTYMFVHTHPIHLIFNLLWLGWFGSMLLQSISQRSLLWLYLGGGVAGGLVYLIFAPHIQLFNGRLLGASASVLALMAYAAVKMPNYRLHLFFIGDVKLKWMALCMIVLAFLGLGGGNSGGELAHLGGAALGFVAGFIPARNRAPKRHNRKPKNAQRVISVIEQHRRDSERLDCLLDKIRVSGYDSLTRREKDELKELSSRVQK